MAAINLLTDRKAASLKAGFHSDGSNLYLRVSDTGAKSWIYRCQIGGKVKQLGLGSFPARSLAEARKVAVNMRAAVVRGDDPSTVLKPKVEASRLNFRFFAEAFIKTKGREFRNGKHLAQWPSTLKRYAYPFIGEMIPVDIEYAHIEAILNQPELTGKRETLSRLRQRLASILEYASDREGDHRRYNPALRVKLAKRKPDDVRHHASEPWEGVPTIMAALAKKPTVTSANVLRFTILTALRSGEARKLLWAWIDLPGAMLTIPGVSMKSGKLHRVPLCAEALAILTPLAEAKAEDATLVFPNSTGKPLSDVAVSKQLSAIKSGVTVHGFRSSFRVWGAEAGFSREALELALAHINPNKVELAYQRSDLFDIRKPIMKLWGQYCATETHSAR